MYTLDCRDKLTLEDGSTCVFLKATGWDFLPRFDLYDSSGALAVKCRMIGKLFRHLSLTDAKGRELATTRFKWCLPILHLPDGTKTELCFFRHLGTDFCPEAEVELFGATLCCTDGVFAIRKDIVPEHQDLVKAILCFCRQYPKAREKELERGRYISLACDTALAMLLGVLAWTHVFSI